MEARKNAKILSVKNVTEQIEKDNQKKRQQKQGAKLAEIEQPGSNYIRRTKTSGMRAAIKVAFDWLFFYGAETIAA